MWMLYFYMWHRYWSIVWSWSAIVKSRCKKESQSERSTIKSTIISILLQSLQERKTKLKNPHYFISKTRQLSYSSFVVITTFFRLSVRNLPASTTEKSLKTLMLQHSDRQAIIKQVIVQFKTERYTNLQCNCYTITTSNAFFWCHVLVIFSG